MRPMLATAHYATRKGLNRPFARVTARDRRMGQKLSMGLTPKQVARLEGMASADVETLVAEPEFKALIDGYNTLHAMPEDEQRRILTQLARHLLMEATALGDVRVATFVILQERMGKDPARTLADGVIAAARRAPAPAPAPRTPSTSPRPARPSDDPDLRAMQRVESRLRGELQQEHAAVHAAVAADEAPPVAEEAAPGAAAAAAALASAFFDPDPQRLSEPRHRGPAPLEERGPRRAANAPRPGALARSPPRTALLWPVRLSRPTPSGEGPWRRR